MNDLEGCLKHFLAPIPRETEHEFTNLPVARSLCGTWASWSIVELMFY